MAKKIKFGKPLDQRRIEIYDNYFKSEYEINGITVYTPLKFRNFHDNKELLYTTRQLSLSYRELISYFIEKGLIQEIKVKEINKKLYLTKYFNEKGEFEKSVEIARNLYTKGYLCHYSAVYLNGLTEQIPKVVCINSEQRMMYNISDARNELSQEKINRAFEKTIERGQSSEVLNFKIRKISGKQTKNTGVERREIGGISFNVTNLERTLIDIIVRPELSGGLNEVISAYRYAIMDHNFSIKKLIHYIKQIDFVYPYYQSIGFLLNFCGSNKDSLSEFKKEFTLKYDFYLIHGSVNKNKQDLIFDETWRIYFPKYLQ